jgi:hypothetical protein
MTLQEVKAELYQVEPHDLPLSGFLFDTEKNRLIIEFAEFIEETKLYEPFCIVFNAIYKLDIEYGLVQNGFPIDGITSLSVERQVNTFHSRIVLTSRGEPGVSVFNVEYASAKHIKGNLQAVGY